MAPKNSALVVKTLLGAKLKMEKKKTFAARSLKRVRQNKAVNSISSLKALQDIRSLKRAKGNTRKEAAADILRMALVKPALKPPAKANAFCTNCGAKVPAGSGFCGECGTKIA